MTHYDPSPASLRPLFDTFWSPRGWKQPSELPTGIEFAQSLAAGVMFAEPRELDHDGWVAATRAGVAAMSPSDIEAAFVASLEHRRLDLRSALGSYAIARHLSKHDFVAGPSGLCAICGLQQTKSRQDLNVLSFERFKWGGVRRDDLRYVAFDLEQFQMAPQLLSSPEAVEKGRALLEALRDSAADATATKTATRLRMIEGNQAEREVVIDILGVCGVLESEGHPGYLSEFVPYIDRDLPNRHFVDRTYPACWWRGRDGVSEVAVQILLPSLA